RIAWRGRGPARGAGSASGRRWWRSARGRGRRPRRSRPRLGRAAMTNTAATRKTIAQLRPADFQEFPIWTFEGSGNEDLLLRPVTKWPVTDLGGSVAGPKGTPANGPKGFAPFGDTYPHRSRATHPPPHPAGPAT